MAKESYFYLKCYFYGVVVHHADHVPYRNERKIKYLLAILTTKKALHFTQKSTEITQIEPKRRRQRQNYTC